MVSTVTLILTMQNCKRDEDCGSTRLSLLSSVPSTKCGAAAGEIVSVSALYLKIWFPPPEIIEYADPVIAVVFPFPDVETVVWIVHHADIETPGAVPFRSTRL
eukprot:SAG31_NODE_4622_length_3090_cov_1.329990_3_plen_103_part_00